MLPSGAVVRANFRRNGSLRDLWWPKQRRMRFTHLMRHQLVHYCGGIFLHSCSLSWICPSWRAAEKGIEQLKNMELKASRCYRWRWGSNTVLRFVDRARLPAVGVPANHWQCMSSDFTIGRHSCYYSYGCIDKTRDTHPCHRRTFVIEAMGRNVGDIALQAVSHLVDEIIVPEEGFTRSKKLLKALRVVMPRVRSTTSSYWLRVSCQQDEFLLRSWKQSWDMWERFARLVFRT